MTKNLIQTVSLLDRKRKWVSRFWQALIVTISLVAILPLFFVFAYVIFKGAPGLNIEFFTETPRPIGEPGGGMANAITGSAVIILMASLLGVPWGIGAGIYLAEYRDGKTNKILKFMTDLLTSVPSIIVGLFAYALVVAPLHHYSSYAGAVALAIIMVPIVARTTEEILKLMPNHIREAGLALGLPKWRVIMSVVLPGSLGGVVTGVMLALARIAGETAPLLFTAFSNNFGFRGLNSPISSLPVQIFNYASSHDDHLRAQAWTGALVLVSVVLILNLSTRALLKWSRR